MSIESRMPRAEYDQIQAISITRLKELRRSPQHYRYALAHPKTSDAMTLGIATHVAVLEPERFQHDFCIWERVTDAGKQAPRSGQHWDAFSAANPGRTVLTRAEGALAMAIATAVRSNPIALRYLETGDPEVSLDWTAADRPAKGRVDWLTTIDGTPTVVGLKTARDCRHFAFGAQSAKLGYHLQWGYYHDGYRALTGHEPRMVEIVVESAAPHAVAVYSIPSDIIDQGREEYERLLALLAECEATDTWPGPVPTEEPLTLPSWAYPALDDDISELGLETP